MSEIVKELGNQVVYDPTQISDGPPNPMDQFRDEVTDLNTPFAPLTPEERDDAPPVGDDEPVVAPVTEATTGTPPVAPTPATFNFEGASIDATQAQARLADYESVLPAIAEARRFQINPADAISEGLKFMAGNQQFEESPDKAVALITRLVDAARQIHGDKFTIPESVTAVVDPESLTEEGKLLYRTNQDLAARNKEMEGYVRTLAAQVTTLSNQISAQGGQSADLKALHEAHPETVNVVDISSLEAMKLESGLTNPVAAYRYVSFSQDRVNKLATPKSTGGAPVTPGTVKIPDAPRTGSRSVEEFDPYAPGVTADDTLRAHRQGRPMKAQAVS